LSLAKGAAGAADEIAGPGATGPTLVPNAPLPNVLNAGQNPSKPLPYPMDWRRG